MALPEHFYNRGTAPVSYKPKPKKQSRREIVAERNRREQREPKSKPKPVSFSKPKPKPAPKPAPKPQAGFNPAAYMDVPGSVASDAKNYYDQAQGDTTRQRNDPIVGAPRPKPAPAPVVWDESVYGFNPAMGMAPGSVGADAAARVGADIPSPQGPTQQEVSRFTPNSPRPTQYSGPTHEDYYEQPYGYVPTENIPTGSFLGGGGKYVLGPDRQAYSMAALRGVGPGTFLGGGGTIPRGIWPSGGDVIYNSDGTPISTMGGYDRTGSYSSDYRMGGYSRYTPASYGSGYGGRGYQPRQNRMPRWMQALVNWRIGRR